MLKKIKYFPPVEILIVFAIIAFISVIVIFAINPPKQLPDLNNARRRNDVNAILNSVFQYAINTNGSLPTTITTTSTPICSTGGDCTGLIDLSVLTANKKYLDVMPKDPDISNSDSTGYSIVKSTNGRVTVFASASVTDGGLTMAISITK